MAVFVGGQRLALLHQAVGVLQDLGRQAAVLLGQFANGGRCICGIAFGCLRLLHLLLQLLATALGNALVQPGHARRALQQFPALRL
ncbi:hypothetical protein D3C72_1948880 [compost metagenome]